MVSKQRNNKQQTHRTLVGIKEYIKDYIGAVLDNKNLLIFYYLANEKRATKKCV